jgi:hypothetical protein
LQNPTTTHSGRKVRTLEERKEEKQAELSRATLEFSSESSPNFSLRTHKSHLLRSSSIGCRFPLDVVFISRFVLFWYVPLSLSFKFKEDPISGC